MDREDGEYITVWCPSSPGMRVEIPNRWWNRRRQFATLGQSIRYSERKQRERDGG
jgi:hypothetical protein